MLELTKTDLEAISRVMKLYANNIDIRFDKFNKVRTAIEDGDTLLKTLVDEIAGEDFLVEENEVEYMVSGNDSYKNAAELRKIERDALMKVFMKHVEFALN